jgi:hypothetical protein
MDEIVDTSHPVWAEFAGMKIGHESLSPRNWHSYIKYFTRDQLEIFTYAFPKIIDNAHLVIDNIINCCSSETDTVVLDLLIDVWGCDYSQSDKYDCLDMCLYGGMGSINKVRLLKYFIDHGATFQHKHIECAVKFSPAIVKFLIENSADPNYVALSFFEHYKRHYETFYSCVQNFIDSGIDVTGCFEHVNQKK